MPDGVAAAPPSIVERLADRVSVPATAIVDYGTRSQTRTEHLVEVLAFEGWVTAAPSEWEAIDEFLFARALEHDSPRLLFNAACEFCGCRGSCVPVFSACWSTSRPLAIAPTRRRGIGSRRTCRPSCDRCSMSSWVVDASAGGSRHEWLERAPTTSNAANLRGELDKLEFLRSIGADRLYLTVLPGQRRRLLARAARRSSVTARRDPWSAR